MLDFITPEDQSKRDRIVNSPSWAALAFYAIYLACMRLWSLAAVALMLFVAAILPSIVPIVSIPSQLVTGLTAMLLIFWLYVVVVGKRLAWTTRSWRNLDHFLACQRAWDAWAKGFLALAFPFIAAVMATVRFGKDARETELIIAGSFSLTLAAGLIWTWMRARSSSRWARGVFVLLWIMGYILLIGAISVLAEKLGVDNKKATPVLAMLLVLGPLVMLGQLLRWSGVYRRKARTPETPESSRRLLQPFRTAAESLRLPFLRPILFVPFLIVLLLEKSTEMAFGISTLVEPPASQNYRLSLWIAILIFPLYILAGEVISEMVAQLEKASDPAFGRSFKKAVRRLPATLVAFLMFLFGITLGFVALVLPGLILAMRWVFVPQAVLLGGVGPIQAFKMSTDVTRGHRWRIAFMLLIVSLWTIAFKVALDKVPQIGSIGAAWLDLSWGTIALTLAYLRVGGPIRES